MVRFSHLAMVGFMLLGGAVAQAQEAYPPAYAPTQQPQTAQLSDNMPASMPQAAPVYVAPVAPAPQPVAPVQQGEYGQSAVTDLRQLNF